MHKSHEHLSWRYRLSALGVATIALLTACSQRVRPPMEVNLNKDQGGTVVINDDEFNLGDAVNKFVEVGLTPPENAPVCLEKLDQELDPYLIQNKDKPWERTFVVVPHTIDYEKIPESCRTLYDAASQERIVQATQQAILDAAPTPTPTPSAMEQQIKETIDATSSLTNDIKDYLTWENISDWLRAGAIGHAFHLLGVAAAHMRIRERRKSGYGINYDRDEADFETGKYFKKEIFSLSSILLGYPKLYFESAILLGNTITSLNRTYIQSGIHHPWLDPMSEFVTKVNIAVDTIRTSLKR